MRKIAINGFGRIGRLALRQLIDISDVELVAVNDLSSPEMLAYLLKYDSIQGVWNRDVNFDEEHLIVDDKKIKVLSEKSPEKLPWRNLDIDLVIECTGYFATREKSKAHLAAGAKKVLISAPAGKDVKTVVFNVNHDILNSEDQIISSGSCTTNCLALMANVIHEAYTIQTAQMTTIHAYTNSQALLDIPDPKGNFRGSRAAANSIVPYKTGAAKAIGLVIPDLEGKLDGSSQRVPVSSGSVVELFSVLEKKVSVEEVNQIMEQSTNESLGYTKAQLVSSDIVGTTYGSLFDATQTKITNVGNQQLVKTVAWYDNEMSFVHQLVRLTNYLIQL